MGLSVGIIFVSSVMELVLVFSAGDPTIVCAIVGLFVLLILVSERFSGRQDASIANRLFRAAVLTYLNMRPAVRSFAYFC